MRINALNDERVVPYHAHGATGDVSKQAASVVDHLNRTTVHRTVRVVHDAAAGRKAQRLMAKADPEKRGCLALHRQFCQPHRQTRFLRASRPRAEQEMGRP